MKPLGLGIAGLTSKFPLHSTINNNSKSVISNTLQCQQQDVKKNLPTVESLVVKDVENENTKDIENNDILIKFRDSLMLDIQPLIDMNQKYVGFCNH